MQEMPSPCTASEFVGSGAVDQVMPDEHDGGYSRNDPTWQPNQCRQRDHRKSDREDGAAGHPEQVELESPAELDQGEIDQDQPQAAHKKKATERSGVLSAAVEERGESSEENEGGGAYVRYPAREKQRGFRDIARIEAGRGEEVSRMIQRHDRHDQAAQDIDRSDTRSFPSLYGDAIRRGGRGFSRLCDAISVHGE